MPKIVSDFFVGFCLAFSPATLGTMVIRYQVWKQMVKNKQAPTFKVIEIKTASAELSKDYIANRS